MDQTPCPKCRRMYCEGFWKKGVCIADMHFGYCPTANFDAQGEYLRVWYEANKESWWQRRRGRRSHSFMLSLIGEVHRIDQEMKRQTRMIVIPKANKKDF